MPPEDLPHGTLSKESKLYGMKDSATSPPSPLPCTVQSKTNTLLPPQPPPIPQVFKENIL